MAPPIPVRDGDVNLYNLTNSTVSTPRIYFVNGIRVLPSEHAQTAAYLSLLIERPVWGVHNATAGKGLGLVIDIGQCLLDYIEDAGARTTSAQNLNKPPKVTDDQIPAFLRDLEKNYVV